MRNKKSGNPIDKEVGAKVRLQRLTLGLSQTDLADGLGLTFQQVQKYEKGTNRIAASRLQQIASILKVEPPFFFGGAGQVAKPGHGKAHDVLDEFLSDKESPTLIEAFMRIKNPKLRRRLVGMVEQIAMA
jgi:transcriptional regulator with XRE-family HTH domain